MQQSARWYAAVGIAAVLAAVSPHALHAQSTPAAQSGPDGIRLDFRDTDIRVVISALAELAGMSVTYSNLPGTQVTLTSGAPLTRAQVREQLEHVVRSNGLRMVEQGGLFRVEPMPQPGPAEPGAEAGVPAGPGPQPGGVQVFVYRLRHAQADAVAGTLRDLFGLGGLRATGSGTERPGALSRELQENRIPLPGEDSQRPQIGGAFPISGQVSGSVQIVPDPVTNSLLIRGLASDYATISQAVQQLDVRPLQVLIEALVVEVRRTRDDALGASVKVPDQREPATGATIGGDFGGETPGSIAIRVLGLGGVRADVILSALAASSRVTIRQRPVVLAQNNREARILVGSQRPFVQISRTLPTDNSARDEVVQYRDVGTELTITPTINPDGYVALSVLQEVSSATTETQFNAPVISTREVETRLLVKDRHTVVIGGLIEQQAGSTTTGIPVLRDIPLLGRLFRSQTDSRSSTELFILLTPHVLRDDADVEDATRAVEESSRAVGKLLESYDPVSGRERPLRPKPENEQ
ncbi:MAG TPA: secretin N-terminal domain-containing protein [Longimicrobium sp.]|jgi:general secretion pathway protein D